MKIAYRNHMILYDVVYANLNRIDLSMIIHLMGMLSCDIKGIVYYVGCVMLMLKGMSICLRVLLGVRPWVLLMESF